MSKTVRGWEKPKPVVASSAPAVVQSPAVAPITAPSGVNIHSIVKGFSREEEAAHRQAYMHLMQSLSGTSVDVDVTDGRTVAGVFYAATPFRGEQQRIVLKTARILKNGATADQETTEPLSTIFTDFKDVVVVRTAKLNLQTKNYNHEFATDSTIKKHGDMSSLDGRRLESVSSSWLDPTTDTSLGSSVTSADGKQWDQFAANKQLFNVTSSYDENLYTKKLDMTKVSREQIAHAERMAREIEGTVSTNIHMKQERGQAMEEEISEEDLFSGVLTRPAAAPVKENAWSRGVKINFKDTVPVPPPAGLGPPKGNKGASSPASKTRPVPGATPISAVGAPAAASPSKMPLLSAPPNLPPPPTLRPVQAAKALPSLSPNPSPITAVEGNSASASVEAVAPEIVKPAEVAPVVAAVEVAAVVAPAAPVVAEVKPASKPLNAGAKEFVFKFNPSAAAWTPPAAFKPPVAAPAPAPVVVVVPQTPPQQYLPNVQQPQQQLPPNVQQVQSSPLQVPVGVPQGVYNYSPHQQGPSPGGNHNPNDYKSPAQVPLAITQSPSGGPMLMPAQPNFMPMPYAQIPPEFAMQFAMDPNGMMAPQQMPNGAQWMMPQGVPGGPPFDPRGIPMMGFPQGFPVPQTAQEQQFLMQQGLVAPPIMMPDGQFMPPPWGMPMQAFGPPNGEQGVGFPVNPLMSATPQQIQAMMQGGQPMFMPPPGSFPQFMAMPQQGFLPSPQQQQMMQQQILQQGNHQQQQQQQQGGANNGGGNGNNGGNNYNNYHRDNNNQQQQGGGGGGGQNYNNNKNNNYNNDRNNNNGGGRGGRGYNNNGGGGGNYNRERYNNNNSSNNSNYRDRDRNNNNSNNSQPGTPGGGNREAHSNFAKEGANNSSPAAAAAAGVASSGGNEESHPSAGASISAEPLSTPSK